ncbi:MAG: DUF1080 domain-containing protein [Planctomycetes bacterium]|nr:DUF1080 domain-containing protein [Planctomycetota bacterium]
MRRSLELCVIYFSLLAVCNASPVQAEGEQEDGFVSLFNGTDFTEWKVPAGDNGHWRAVDGVIDYDAASEAKGDRNLWTEKEYGDFILKIDWRIKQTSGLYNVPIVLNDGTYLKDASGKKLTIKMPNADSGIFIRGSSRAQLNIWCWPIGSGEVYGYRNNPTTSSEVRVGVTPRVNADNPVGEWNSFTIIMVKDRLTVILNNKMVLENAQLPEVPGRGAIALQHHGGVNADGSFKPASSLVQFRNVWIKELDSAE